MNRKYKKIIIISIAFCLPLITLASPDWLKINGITPCWPVVWLLPFSLNYPPLISVFTAIILGFFMDSFTIGIISYIPSLFLLSLFWSRYAMHNKNINLLFNIGLMAIFGAAFVGLSIWIQKIILYENLRNNWFNSWAIYALISEIIITGLVAPLFSSWLLLSYKRN